ncbi:MAG: hypothetical protein PHW04_07090 [Candidatus Wallbacteria bacterium]|nr:hypothetical protein [Candidatus Wallbacteria bacterium]
MKSLAMMFFLTLIGTPLVAAQGNVIEYSGKTPAGLVGNGRSVVKVRSDGYEFHTGGDAAGTFEILIDGHPVGISSKDAGSVFFPGGVVYSLAVHGLKVEILHGATEENPYVLAVRVAGKKKSIALKISQHGAPALSRSGLIPIEMKKNKGELILFSGTKAPHGTFSDLRKQWEEQYQKGFVLKTPSELVNRAVPFNRYLLDLGFDGHLHVCEIFRWRDVWSRDLGTGLVPGAMASGQFSRARTTLEYDLGRYAANNPAGLKATEDPSQGGSAEGTSWLANAVWHYFLLTGDRKFLADAEKVLLPWVNAWIGRDYRREGLLVDVTEWMDHSRFFLFPDGARVLYSNALFADLLNTFSMIERTLGDCSAASRLQSVRDRFVAAINNVLWNESTGEYDNLSLWDLRDTRSSAAENSLAVLCGVAPADRIGRTLETVKNRNWRAAGSTTIYPPMSHVEANCDHNYKMWPWWNAVEARARLQNGDIAGGIHLLECCSKTLEDEHYPGMMEELTSPEGVTEGGNAFLSAAGSYQYAIVEGLLGIEILEPGCARIRVSPNVPAEWKDWSATVPLPGGEIFLSQENGKLYIRVTDPRVKIVESVRGAAVEGAESAAVSPRIYPDLAKLPSVKPLGCPQLKNRRAAVFHDDSFPAALPDGLPRRYVTVDELLCLDSQNISALIVPGNALPLKTRAGVEIRPALTRFLDRGNAIVFYGGTMQDRWTMGETGGIVDWYDYRHLLAGSPLDGWVFKTSQAGTQVWRETESGFVNGWFRQDYPDQDWEPVKIPGTWEDHLKKSYEGWGWYRHHFQLPAEARGRSILFELGAVDDADWVYLNGILVGSEWGRDHFQRYALKPGDPAYASLNFGKDNLIAVQVVNYGGGGGLYKDPPRMGIESDQFTWAPIDARTEATLLEPKRFGVISWGKGDFFNSWETSRGAFGFKIAGSGIEFSGPLAGMPSISGSVQEAFTDFAISSPLFFQPLAFTKTDRKLLSPDDGERYPCLARVVNTRTGGEFIMIPVSVTGACPEVLEKLGIK